MNNSIEKTIPFVWILERNLLAAKYLLQVLGEDSSIETRWIDESKPPHRKELGAEPLFLMDNAGLEGTITADIRNVNAQFRNPAYIVLDKEFESLNVDHLLSLGVRGFVTHDGVRKNLQQAVHCVLTGGTWIDSTLFGKCAQVRSVVRPFRLTAQRRESLTSREHDILHLARQRLSNREIASVLRIEVSTVKFHLSNVFSKLQVTKRVNLWRGSSINLIVQHWMWNGNSVPQVRDSDTGLQSSPYRKKARTEPQHIHDL